MKKRELATKIKDRVVKFEPGAVKNVAVKDRIQMFEEKTPPKENRNKFRNQHATIVNDKKSDDSVIKMPRFPPPVITKTSEPELPRLPTLLLPEAELADSEILLQSDDLNAELASKPLWKGREYLKQLSTEELRNNLRIIEKLRESYIEEINESSDEKNQHDIAIYREENDLNHIDNEFGLSDFEDEESYIVEAYNTVGNELVISKLHFDHKEDHHTNLLMHENAFENQSYVSKNNLDQINNEIDLYKRGSQYSETSSEDSTYMSIRDCLSGASYLYENTKNGDLLKATATQNTKSKNLKIKIDVTLDGDDDDDDDLEGFLDERQQEALFVPSEKKDYLIQEMVNTEEKYISDLEKIVKHYMPYLQKANLPLHLQGKQHVLFGNIIEIYTESKNFHAALKTCGYDHEIIAETFLRFKILFQLYPLYSKNKPKADLYLPEFRKYARGKQEELGERLDLGSYLLTPIQRLGKYILFLKGINEQLNKRCTHSITVQAALDMVKEVMSRANDYIAIDSIKNCPINLSKEAGSFVMREKFLLHRANKVERTFEAMVFFFDQIIVFTIETSKDKEAFSYIESIKMTDLVLVPSQSEPLIIKLESYSESKRSPKSKDQCVYILEAKSQRIRQFWTQNIEKRLWEQMDKWKEEVKAQYGKGETSPNAQPSKNRQKLERAQTLPERRTRRSEKKKSSTFYIKLS